MLFASPDQRLDAQIEAMHDAATDTDRQCLECSKDMSALEVRAEKDVGDGLCCKCREYARKCAEEQAMSNFIANVKHAPVANWFIEVIDKCNLPLVSSTDNVLKFSRNGVTLELTASNSLATLQVASPNWPSAPDWVASYSFAPVPVILAALQAASSGK